MQFMKKTFSQSFLKKIAIVPVDSLAVAACNPLAGDIVKPIKSHKNVRLNNYPDDIIFEL